MMRRNLILTTVSLAMATMISVSAARATVYDYSFLSFDNQLALSGTMTVDDNNVITGMTGSFAGLVTQTIDGITPNPNLGGQATSPDGMFYYDNVLVSGNPSLDTGGVLFTTAENQAGYWNLWGTGANSYDLYESVSGNYPVEESGLLTLSAAPPLASGSLDERGAPAPDAAHGGAAMFALAALLFYSRSRRAGLEASTARRA